VDTPPVGPYDWMTRSEGVGTPWTSWASLPGTDPFPGHNDSLVCKSEEA
jgi:hypothetical protein